VFGADHGLWPALKRSQKLGQRRIGIVVILRKVPSAVSCFSSPREKFVLLTLGGLIRVYASEGLRATLVPQFPHLSLLAIVAGLAFFNVLFLVVGLRQFHRKAID
jgi:hypothetical protein